MKVLVLLVLVLVGCERFGLSSNANSIGRIQYKTDACEFRLWQSALTVSEQEITKFNIHETVSMDSECSLSIEYHENETTEDN